MKVAMIDLLAQTPFYDRHLSEAVAPLVDRLTLYSARFHYEPDYFQSVDFERTPGLTDQLGLAFSRSKLLRRVVRMMEYHLNWRRILYTFRSNPPNVAHIQWLPLLNMTPIFNEIGYIQSLKSMEIPIVYTIHNYSQHDAHNRSNEVYDKLYKTADHLIVHTHSDFNRLISDGIENSRISVIPQGAVFADQYGISCEVSRESLKITKNDFVLLMMGVIRPYKGIENVIKSLALVLDNHSEIELRIVGNVLDTLYLKYLQQLAVELGVQRHLQWQIGYIPSSQVGAYHAAADVVLFPYRNISQSGAFLTAAALGKCTLTTRVGGLAEIIRDGENGIQISSSEPEKIAEGIRRCLQMTVEQRNKMGLSLRQYIESHCDWMKIGRKTVEVYTKVVGHAA